MEARFGWFRRRAWVLLPVVAIVVVVAQFVAERRPVMYEAQAVLVVPSGASAEGPGSSGEAARLAGTYAELIPADSRVLDEVSQRVGLRADEIEENLDVDHVSDTSLLRVSFTSTDSDEAIAVAEAVAESVSGSNPVTETIAAESLLVARLPTSTTTVSQPRASATAVGIILGLALGAVAMVIWERSDARVDTEEALAMELGCPAAVMEELGPAGVAALLDRWRDMAEHSPARVALVAVSPWQIPTTTDVGERLMSDARTADLYLVLTAGRGSEELLGGGLAADLRHSGTPAPTPSGVTGLDTVVSPRTEQAEDSTYEGLLPHIVIEAAGATGGYEAAQSVAASSDLTIAVVPRGSRLADVARMRSDLAEFGSSVDWALLVDRPRRIPFVSSTVRHQEPSR